MTPDRLIADLNELFNRLQVRYAIVGSVASISYGEPRLTNDVDVIAELKPEHVSAIVSAFPAPDFYLSDAAIRSAIANKFQFNILHVTEGLKADVIQSAGDELHRSLLDRRVWLEVGETGFAWVASPEDVILGKLQYHRLGGSPKHIRDIVGILKIADRPIDLAYIEAWVPKLTVQESWSQVVRSWRAGSAGKPS